MLGASPGFGTAETQQFFRIIDEQADRMSGLIGDRHQTLAAQAGSHLTLRRSNPRGPAIATRPVIVRTTARDVVEIAEQSGTSAQWCWWL